VAYRALRGDDRRARPALADRVVELDRLAVVDGVRVPEAPRFDLHQMVTRRGRPERRDDGRVG